MVRKKNKSIISLWHATQLFTSGCTSEFIVGLVNEAAELSNDEILNLNL